MKREILLINKSSKEINKALLKVCTVFSPRKEIGVFIISNVLRGYDCSKEDKEGFMYSYVLDFFRSEQRAKKYLDKINVELLSRCFENFNIVFPSKHFKRIII